MTDDIIQRLRDIYEDDDHERGCPGRNYQCTCGFDARTYETAEAAVAEIARLTAERDAAVACLERIERKVDAADATLDRIQRMIDPGEAK
jgi:hypothetical protein